MPQTARTAFSDANFPERFRRKTGFQGRAACASVVVPSWGIGPDARVGFISR